MNLYYKFFKREVNIVVAIVLMLQLTTTASAQCTQTDGCTAKSSVNMDSNISELTKDYDRLSISYDNLTFTGKSGYKHCFFGESTLGTNGFGLAYTHGFSISKEYPIFIETGLKLTATFCSAGYCEYIEIEDDELDIYFHLHSRLQAQMRLLAAPLNLAYKVRINDRVSFVPYFGLNFKVNLSGRIKLSIGEGEDEIKSDWIELFSSNEEYGIGDKDLTWNRFQVGWHVGIGFDINEFYVGANYGADFIAATKHMQHRITDGHFALTFGLKI